MQRPTCTEVRCEATGQKWPGEDRGRDWSLAATCCGRPVASVGWKGSVTLLTPSDFLPPDL